MSVHHVQVEELTPSLDRRDFIGEVGCRTRADSAPPRSAVARRAVSVN
jgi:hypothetical protein